MISNYYYTSIYKYINDYRTYIILKQKLNSYRFVLELYQDHLNSIFFNIYNPTSKHKYTEFDLLNIFKRQLRFSEIKSGPKINRILDDFEYD